MDKYAEFAKGREKVKGASKKKGAYLSKSLRKEAKWVGHI